MSNDKDSLELIKLKEFCEKHNNQIDTIRCSCFTHEHLITLTYFFEDSYYINNDESGILLNLQMSSEHSFFKRILIGIKYIFGINTNGHWCSTIVTKNDIIKLIKAGFLSLEYERLYNDAHKSTIEKIKNKEVL